MLPNSYAVNQDKVYNYGCSTLTKLVTRHWKGTSGHCVHYISLSTSKELENGYVNIAVRTFGSSNLLGRKKRPNGQEDAHCLTSIFQMLAQKHLISNPDIHLETARRKSRKGSFELSHL